MAAELPHYCGTIIVAMVHSIWRSEWRCCRVRRVHQDMSAPDPLEDARREYNDVLTRLRVLCEVSPEQEEELDAASRRVTTAAMAVLGVLRAKQNSDALYWATLQSNGKWVELQRNGRWAELLRYENGCCAER